MQKTNESMDVQWIDYTQDTLDSIFLPGRVYNPRPSFVPAGVIPGVGDRFDDRIGTNFPIFPETLQLAPGMAVSDYSRELVTLAGFRFPSPEKMLIYNNRGEYEALMRDVPPGQMVLDHIHPEEALDPEKYWVPRDVVGSLINKADLERWVPEAYLAKRRVVTRANAEREAGIHFQEEGECVLKTTGAVPTGGAFGVCHVRHLDDFAKQLASFPGEGDVVLERFMESESSYCLNFVLPERRDGSDPMPEYLGVSLQVIAEGLVFKGGLVPNRGLPAHETIQAGAEVARLAAKGGFRGMLGLDVLETTNHGPVVVDINPRMNYSTPAILLARNLRKRLGSDILVGAMTSLLPPGTAHHMLEVMRELIRKEIAFPMRWFIYPPGGPVEAKTLMLLPAENERQLEQVRNELIQLGFPA